MGDQLKSLGFNQRFMFNRYAPEWTRQAWQIARLAKGKPIPLIRLAREELGKIVPAAMTSWAQKPFLELLYEDQGFRHLVGLRVCQWCFDDDNVSERRVELVYKVIDVICIVDGIKSFGGTSQTVIRLDPAHNRELDYRLTGILIRTSSAADHITMEWISQDDDIKKTPVNGRLIGGSLLNTLNPQHKIVHAVDKQVIWTPKPPT